MQGLRNETAVHPSTERRVRRWEHEAVLEEMQLWLSKALNRPGFSRHLASQEPGSQYLTHK